jgi:thiamine biosynthesis lipoprotein
MKDKFEAGKLNVWMPDQVRHDGKRHKLLRLSFRQCVEPDFVLEDIKRDRQIKEWKRRRNNLNQEFLRDFMKEESRVQGCESTVFIKTLSLFLCFLLLTLLSSCSSQKEHIFRKSAFLMDTIVTVTVVSATKEGADKAVDSAFSEIGRLGKLCDFFSPDSEISKINKNAGVSEVKVSPDIIDLFEKTVYVSQKTGGAFDVTIGPVERLYDFHKKIKPREDEIRKNLPLVDYKGLIIHRDRSAVFLRKKGMLIDPGGITKGYAADKAVEVLRKYGIRSGIVAIAGDIRTFGLKPDGTPWRIGIKNPRSSGRDDDIMAVIGLSDMAISTSGDYERFFISDGRRYHHLLDPRTGHSAGGCKCVSVIAKEGAFADSFATAIFVLGPEKGMKVLQKLGFDGVIIDSQDGVYMTPGIRGKIEFKKTAEKYHFS